MYYGIVKLKAKKSFSLESLAASHESESRLTMYFTVNLAFVNFFHNFTKSSEFPIVLKRTTYELISPIPLQTFDSEPELLKADIKRPFLTKFLLKKKFLIYMKGILLMI